MAYIEPAPLLDKENPFEAMMSRFHTASQILGLEDEVYNVLKNPAKQVIVHYPLPWMTVALKYLKVTV
jgi:hypothetical protein